MKDAQHIESFQEQEFSLKVPYNHFEKYSMNNWGAFRLIKNRKPSLQENWKGGTNEMFEKGLLSSMQ